MEIRLTTNSNASAERQELLAASKEVVWENHSVGERLWKSFFVFGFSFVGEGREGCDRYTHIYIILMHITYSKTNRYFECTICICLSKYIYLHMYYRYTMWLRYQWQAFKLLKCCIMSYLKMLMSILYYTYLTQVN